jgi:hypothetical protein
MTQLEDNIALAAMLITIAFLSFRQFLVIRRDPQRDWICRNAYSRFWAASREEWILRLKFGYLSGTLICIVGVLALVATA